MRIVERKEAAVTQQVAWHREFASIISCDACTRTTDPNLLRDELENVPQPGYVGTNYQNKRVLLIGQNPGTPKTLAKRDLQYTVALRALRDDPSPAQYAALAKELEDFIPQWPVSGNYFPLDECGLTLSDIAYCNVVRCRTSNDAAPNDGLASNCNDRHLKRWLTCTAPRVVVFIGKWAWRRASGTVTALGIPNTYMNRQRSLSNADRIANRREVVAVVRSAIQKR